LAALNRPDLCPCQKTAKSPSSGDGSESPAALGQGHTAAALQGAGPAVVAAAGLAGQLAEHCKPAVLQTFVTIIWDL